MTLRSLTLRGAKIGVLLLVLALAGCQWFRVAEKGAEVATKAGSEDTAALKVIEDAQLTASLDTKVAVRAGSKLDSAALADLVDEAPAAGTGSIVLAKVKEELGALFSEAFCQGVSEIAQWRNPSATADPAHWAQFLVDYVERRARELMISAPHEMVVRYAAEVVDGLKLGGINVGKARPYVVACFIGLKKVAAPTAAPAPASVAVGDPCLIGHWIGLSKSITPTVDNVPTVLFGGAGAVLTIDRNGAAVVDYGPSKPFVGSASGQTVAVQEQGTASSRIYAYPPHRLVETIQSAAVTTQWYINGQWQQPSLVPSTPATTYSCSATTLTETSTGGTDTYTRG